MLTNAWTTLKPHPQQSELWRSRERFVAVVAGRGSGKSVLARRRVVRYLAVRKPWDDPEYFYALPTFGQARRIAWEPIKKLIPREWIRDINESSMVIRTVFGSTLRCLGLDKPQRAEGLQYDGGVIDESSDQKPKTFDLTFRPALTHRKGWCWRIGVAKRFGVGALEFKRFFEFCESRAGDGQHAAFHWPSSTVLDPAELLAAKEGADPKDFAEQYEALWQSVAGLVYYCFDPVTSLCPDYTYDLNSPIIVGSDFNVDPMAWVLMQAKDSSLYVFDEVYEHNTNTRKTLDLLHQRYGSHRGQWFFFGDATGQSRKTSAATSDYAQIRSDARFRGSKCYYPSHNPRVVDRIAAVNAAFCDANGKRTLFVHPRCVNLIRDLGYLSYDSGSREINAKDPEAKHVTDALGYPVHYMRPVKPLADESLPRIAIGAA